MQNKNTFFEFVLPSRLLYYANIAIYFYIMCFFFDKKYTFLCIYIE